MNIKNHPKKTSDRGYILAFVTRIISINRIRLATLFLTISIVPTFASAHESLIFKGVDNDISVAIDRGRAITKNAADGKVEIFAIARDVIAHLVKADQVLPLYKTEQKNRRFLVALLRERSRINGSLSYCGAGHEDYVLLLEMANGKITLADDALLQSCMKSILLDSDKGDDPLQAITLRNVGSFSFRWIGDPESAVRIVDVLNGRLVMHLIHGSG
jgi:hypothetical protein